MQIRIKKIYYRFYRNGTNKAPNKTLISLSQNASMVIFVWTFLCKYFKKFNCQIT